MLDLRAIRQRAASRASVATPANPANWLIQEPPISQLATLATVASDLQPSRAHASRPHSLTKSEGDAAHGEPWDDAAIARFVARVSLFMCRGITATDADDLAERLHLRDVEGDDRRLCLECANLTGRATGWRCGNHRAAGVGAELPRALAMTMQRCAGFDGAGK